METTVPAQNNGNSGSVAISSHRGVAGAVFSQKGWSKSHDFYPLIPSAGVASAHDSFTARDAIHYELGEPCTSRRTDPYETTSAAAFALPVQCGSLRQMRSAGRATGTQEQSVGRLLSNQFPATSIGRFLLQRQEKVYRGVQSKPLGRSVPQRGVELPVQDETFRFGIKQTTDEIDAAKKLIFAPVPVPTQEELALYKRTHHSYMPGESFSRGNAVEHIDMHTFCFGKKTSTDCDIDAKQCIHWISAGDGCKIVSKAIEDYHTIRHPQVGKCTRSAAGRPPVPAGFSFGLPTAQDVISAKDCFKMYIPEECDASRATTNTDSRTDREEHFTRASAAEPNERIFGIPSVRTDIKPPKRKPIDDHVNYGDEPAMGELLFPPASQAYDVKDADFLVRLPRDQIHRLLSRSIGTGDDVKLVYRAVDLAFEKSANSNGVKHAAKDVEPIKTDVNSSAERPVNVYCKQLSSAVGSSRPTSRHDEDEPTVSLTDVREAYVDLIRKKVALESRSLTQATDLYVQQPPAITLH